MSSTTHVDEASRLRLRHLVGPRRSEGVPPGVRDRPAAFAYFGRAALWAGARALGLGPGDRVVVPSYHCAVAIEPFIRLGCEPVYYTSGGDGTIDPAELERVAAGDVRALMVIHYFGLPQAMAAVRAICDARGIALIEDCAHVLTGTADGRPQGAWGDVSVFSWRKFLPCLDGGQVVVRPDLADRLPATSRLPLKARLKSWKNHVEKLMGDSPRSTVRRLGETLSAVNAGRVTRSAVRTGGSGAAAWDSRQTRYDPRVEGLPISSASYRVFRRADIEAIAEARRHNYRALVDLLSARGEIEPLRRDLPDGCCPWVLPVRFRGYEGVHRILRERGIPAFTWEDVVHPTVESTSDPRIREMYDAIVGLPIHQDVDRRGLEYISETISTVLDGGVRRA